ncbi:MAG: TrkA family potassium uptake protein [Candidatus Eiseniibacteriota bacterium]|nr:MAG: TrkA family potassium uptake protein [Candidatus Eisenbacteria bacterium]
MKQFAVIGLGSFGYYLCKQLSERGHQVMAVDRSPAKIESVQHLVEKAVLADAVDKETLSKLGMADMDLVIVCLGDEIDSSILTTLYLKELGAKEIWVKAMTEDHGKVLHLIGASNVIFPERDMAERVAYTVSHSNVLEHIPLAAGHSIIELAPPSGLIGRTLGELDLPRRYGVMVLVIKELVPENVVTMPSGSYRIKDSDVLVITGRDRDLKRLQAL